MKIPSILFIAVAPSMGQGIFTRKEFNKNQLIIKEENYIFVTRENAHSTAIEISSNMFLDYKEHPHFLDFVNHSCNPNMRYDVEEFVFYASQYISPGTQLTYDYETTESDMIINGENFDCRCQELACREKIMGYNYKKLTK